MQVEIVQKMVNNIDLKMAVHNPFILDELLIFIVYYNYLSSQSNFEEVHLFSFFMYVLHWNVFMDFSFYYVF